MTADGRLRAARPPFGRNRIHPHGGFGRRCFCERLSSPFPAPAPTAARFPSRLIPRRFLA
ncbi:hypothetical protein BBJ41_05325 [Burkholderia stabilis]|nr:hypothetical protein BBJ41_05325 [Burkholderia stabilis]